MVRSIEGKHPNYYEATLQLRLPKQDIVTYVEDQLHKVKIYVAKVEEVKNGLDYYLSDNQFTQALGKKLQAKFGGELTVTSSLFSKKDGKNIYRTTILFRPTPFRKGDLVIYGGEEYLVKALGKDIYLFGTINKNKVHLRYKDMHLVKQKED